MKYTDNALNIMAARTYKGIGRAWIVKNLESQRPTNEIIGLLNDFLKTNERLTIDDFEKKKSMLRRLIENSRDFMDGAVAIGDDNFPPCRGNVKNSERPIFLFYRGDISLLDKNSNNIAVIGLLNPSPEIESIERKVVSGLIKNGSVIVSGLAFGCDSIAHIQAIESEGKTVAILPSPLNDIMPARNRPLAERIVEKHGLLVTEYLTNPKSKMELGGRYQERDRLQALFSNAIVLTASYSKNDVGNDSGSRLAMGYAKDYSIPRAVIYDMKINQSNPMFDLNRQIINETPDVIVINQENMIGSLDQITGLKPFIKSPIPVQQSII